MATARVELWHGDVRLDETTTWIVLNQDFVMVNTDRVELTFPRKPRRAKYRDGLYVKTYVGGGRVAVVDVSPATYFYYPYDTLLIPAGGLTLTIRGFVQ